MSTIPAKAVVNVQPNVLSAGGSALNLIGLMLTQNVRVPIGAVQSFASQLEVASFFGGTSDEAAAAAIYFAGFEGSNKKPGSMLMAQYNTAAVSAYLRGGDAASLSLTALKAISGTLSVTIDEVVESGSIALSAATSFTSAAQLIQVALDISGPAGAAFTGSIAATVLTVASGLTGTLQVGDEVGGVGVAAGTFLVNQLTGPVGGLGTYTVSESQTVGSVSMTTARAAVSFDSQSGGFIFNSATTGAASTIGFASGTAAAPLFLTQATGAVLSQGADAATPAPFMANVVSQTQNWATFFLNFNPDMPNEITVRKAFASWTSQQNDRYGFICWDQDASPATTLPATASLGFAIEEDQDSGTCLIWEKPTITYQDAAFVSGTAASIDFAQPDGRITFKFRYQPGLEASVTDEQTAQNLGGNPATGSRGNGYNFYGAYATANDEFSFFGNGFVSGRFRWLDGFVNQIWLNNAFQLALVVFLMNSRSVPYNAAGRAAIEAACADVINQGLRFGAYRAGVTLSASQITEVNAQAGRDIASTLSQRGWYLLVGDATPEVRQNRGTPPCTFFYVDGESVQYINLASVSLL